MPDAPETSVPEVGSITIHLLLTENGVETAFSLDGVDPEPAIGYLTIVTDRLRERAKYDWGTCPGCNRPWSEHGDEYDEEEDPS